MAKLAIIANHIKPKPASHATVRVAGSIPVAKDQKYILMDRTGRQQEMRIVGVYRNELVIRDAKATGQSKVASRLKRYDLIEKAIVGTGLLDLFR